MKLQKPVVLIYHSSADQIRNIRGICVPMGVRVLAVLPEQETLPLGFLAGTGNLPLTLTPEMPEPGTPGAKETPAATPEEREPMLVLCGLSNEMLDHFLVRARKMPSPVSLKAVLTETNALWSGKKLQQELRREREAFRGRSQAAT